jgi:PAS domain S-box-containing protein
MPNHASVRAAGDRAALALPGDDSYQSVFDRNPTPMWLYDIDTHRFLAVNAAAVAEYGYPPDVFLALTLRDVYGEADLARFDGLTGDAQDLYTGDWVHRRRDGTSFYVEIRSSDLVFQGHPARLIHVTNVTARKQADSALCDERDRAQQYLDTAEVILLKLDSEGRILLVNRYACTVLGWTADELLGRNWIDTCLPSWTRTHFEARSTTWSTAICRLSITLFSPSLATNGSSSGATRCYGMTRGRSSARSVLAPTSPNGIRP